MMGCGKADGNELCLHYLIAREDFDEVMFLSSVSKLNGEELMSLIRYLGKWLRKYERFPQAYPCPKGSFVLGLKACNWVPTLANVVKCFGLVVDEHFSSLVLQSEFHEELRSLERVANSLSSEATVCSNVTNLVETLKPELKGTPLWRNGPPEKPVLCNACGSAISNSESCLQLGNADASDLRAS